jgi:hypothetical protein
MVCKNSSARLTSEGADESQSLLMSQSRIYSPGRTGTQRGWSERTAGQEPSVL